MTESGIQARNVLCILHDMPDVIRQLCEQISGYEYDFEFSGHGPDDRMMESFKSSDNTVRPSLAESDLEVVSNHQDVAYVLSPRFASVHAIVEARRAIDFVDRCFGVGARAVKCETGLTHGSDQWRELAGQKEDASLYWAWVRRPIGDEGGTYSCGMHLLGLPDVQVVGAQVPQALDLIDGFAMYLLVDKPGDRLQAGNTFSLSSDDPKYRLSAPACTRYEDDDFFFNPHGYWQLEAV